ncbi:MAG: alpha/beta fold hydrolase [Bryobacteraceae bacterium]
MSTASKRFWLVLLYATAATFSVPAFSAGDQFFDSSGVRIRYSTEGRGEPVVLIHGAMSRLEDLGPLLKALSTDYQVIALDLRGHGKSDKPHDSNQYGAEMSADVVRLLDHLKIKKAHVGGSSLGAAVTAKVLETWPDRVLTATLIGLAGARESDLQLYHSLADSLERGKGLGPLALALTPAGQPPPSAEQIQKETDYVLATNDLQAIIAFMRGAKGLVVDYGKMASTGVAAHAVIGELDPFKSGVDELAKAMSSLKVTVLERTGHRCCASPVLQQAVKGFLDSHRAR